MTVLDSDAAPPRVSVIMGTFNGAEYIRDTIHSVLAQTWTDFELLIVDDCSTDETSVVLASITDKRLRVMRNPINAGIAETRNRCFAAARGEYIAMLDHDDLSLPTRLAKQVAYLDAHPDTVLVGTGGKQLDDGKLKPTLNPKQTSPTVIRWYLLIANPLICSSVMFRASVARRLGTLMRDSYKYADDFDLYHRMAQHGDVAQIDESLTIYRLHATNTFRANETVMTGNVVRVLEPAYVKWFGAGAQRAASLIVNHIAASLTVPDATALEALVESFQQVRSHFFAENAVSGADREKIDTISGDMWRRVLHSAATGGKIGLRDLHRAGGVAGVSPRLGDFARLFAGRVPITDSVRMALRSALRWSRRERNPRFRPTRLLGRPWQPLADDPSRPPTMFVVVDTEAEFDWSGPFARDHCSVTAMDALERGQAIFDRYGLRPIYVMDYPVASQARSIGMVRRILERDGCEIGVHLHPWTTPPFDEEVCAHNSFAGNLPPSLEELKISNLAAKIRENFGRSPQFYRAGRHGIGAQTTGILSRLGIKVDLSVLAGADLRARGGPDFRQLQPTPYRVNGDEIISLPMSRAHIGFASTLGAVMEPVLERPEIKKLRLRGVLSHLGILDTITLTPEGVSAAEQKRLIRTMLRRGHRLFVLHYHSPSLEVGHTPYVRTERDLQELLGRLGDVCQFFFEEIGGLPGYPKDLVELAEARSA